MKVLVTGGIGRVGTVVVRRLVEKGYSVRVIDRKPPEAVETPPGVEYAQADINEFGALRETVRGCEAVVHLAAIPSPAGGPPQEVFRVNVAGTFNVYQAAAEEGIRRVVQASSINAIGLHYGLKNADPAYFPIDEDHPSPSTDVYSFSKRTAEEIAAYYDRRAGISGVSLRFPSVRPAAAHEQHPQQMAQTQQRIARLLAMDKTERVRWLDDMLRELGELRALGVMEDPEYQRKVWWADKNIPEEKRWLLGARSNFWAVIDERDAAQAVEKGLSARYEGSHPLFVNDAWNSAGVGAETLARLFFPHVTARKRPLAGKEALVSIERARKLIGFEPEYSFTGKD